MTDSQYSTEVGKRIFLLRKELRMSRRELGEKLKIAETTIKKYEDGKIKGININLISRFAKALKVNDNYLFCMDLRDNDIGSEKNFVKSAKEKDILDMYNKLANDEKETVVKLMKMFLS